MINKTTFNRSVNNGIDNHYTKVDNGLIKDINLSMAQVGVMTWILSQNDSYVINKTYIQKQSGLGKVAFKKVWDGLVEIGYIEDSFTNTTQGREYQYVINENPHN